MVCHAVDCPVYTDRVFCPVHWCCVPATTKSALRSPLFDEVSVSGRLALAKARLAIAELEDRPGVVAWLTSVVGVLERVGGIAPPVRQQARYLRRSHLQGDGEAPGAHV